MARPSPWHPFPRGPGPARFSSITAPPLYGVQKLAAGAFMSRPCAGTMLSVTTGINRFSPSWIRAKYTGNCEGNWHKNKTVLFLSGSH